MCKYRGFTPVDHSHEACPPFARAPPTPKPSLPPSISASPHPMTSTPTSPLRDLFRSNPSKGVDPANEHDLGSPSRLQRLFLRNKTASADQDYAKMSSTTAQPRSILYNFIMASGTTATAKEQRRPYSPRQSQQSSMLLPPLSLFPAATSPNVSEEGKVKQSKSGLFAKGKKEPVAGAAVPSTNVRGQNFSKNRKQAMASDSPAVSTRPWRIWTSGGSGDTTPQITISQVENVKRSKDNGARRMWRSISPSPSDENFNSKDEVDETARKKKTKFLKSSWSSQPKGPTTRLEEYEQEQHHQQVMLHSSLNTSSRSIITTPRHLQRVDEQEQQRTVGQAQCCHPCQSSQQHQQTQSRLNVTIAVHDVFGVGKVTEVMLALFLAHDAFLCRRPFWLQCSILAWEAVVVLMVIWMLMMAIWTVMRVVGVAEILVQGADDLVRETFSVLRQLAQSIRMILFVR